MFRVIFFYGKRRPRTTYSWKAVFSSKPGISSKVYLMLVFIIKLYKEILERENDILKVSYLPTSLYNFLPFLVLLSQYKGLNFDVLDIWRIRQLWNCQIRFKNNQVVPINWNNSSFTHVRRSHLVRYLVLYTLTSKKVRVFHTIQRGKTFTKSVAKLRITKVFLDKVSKYVFVVSESKWTQNIVFIVFSACK